MEIRLENMTSNSAVIRTLNAARGDELRAP